MKRQWIFIAKLTVSMGAVGWIVHRILQREGASDLWAKLSQLSWFFIAVAALMQVSAIVLSVLRWDRLLVGQGIHSPFKHLFGSFMIGRFFGAFTPGGWTGLNGYRLYDIAKLTGKTARSTATIGVEMILGYMAFAIVVVIGSLFGLDVIGLKGVLTVDLFFLGLIFTAVVLITRPNLFRFFASQLPPSFRSRLQTTVDAVCSYQGKGVLIVQAILLGVGTHTFNNLIYVATARALGVELSVGQVFFVSAMQIFATLLPASLNGIGVREATAVALYTSMGLPESIGLLIPMVGFTVEMVISSFGGLIFIGRRVGYTVNIEVDDADREEFTHRVIKIAPRELWPKLGRGLMVAMCAGLMGGGIVGAGEASVIILTGSGHSDLSVFVYGITMYSIGCGIVVAVAGWALAMSGRILKREALPDVIAYARYCAATVGFGTFVLATFRIRRDLFQEDLVWKSPKGLLVLLLCLLVAFVLYYLVARFFQLLVSTRVGRPLMRLWGSIAALGIFVLGFGAVSLFKEPTKAAAISDVTKQQNHALKQSENILFIVVDTLRYDHLSCNGYQAIETPHVDAFAKDAIRFDHAFANASWTRPSFASILTGRYPKSHRTDTKSDSLPDDILTLPEVLRSNGYSTYGIVTNYNLAPFFNFHQGFDQYRYLEPNFVFGASDTAAKLLFLQFAKRVDEKLRAKRGLVSQGSAYQDAETVNQVIFEFLDHKPRNPWFLFVGYMDPHDPYYPHPYNGTGYSRAANPTPNPAKASYLRDLYNGEIVYWDKQFGKLIEQLKVRDVYDSTMIILTADHGEEFLDHGGFWHGTTLYDEQIRVPLIIKLPFSERQNQTVSHWVESIDLMPFILTREGINMPDGAQGKDVFVASDRVFAEENHEGNLLESLRVTREGQELKVIQANPQNPRGLQPFELYRTDIDPRELNDLSSKELDDLAFATKELDTYGKNASQGAVHRRTVDVSADQKDKLKALGYIGEE